VQCGDGALDDEGRDEPVQRGGPIEIGFRREPAGETVHHRGPFRAAQLG
jgi:hypothetical protein